MRCETEEGVKQIHLVSEARAVFVASNVDGTFPKEEAVIKVRMGNIFLLSTF